jgi:hypothetical protein
MVFSSHIYGKRTPLWRFARNLQRAYDRAILLNYVLPLIALTISATAALLDAELAVNRRRHSTLLSHCCMDVKCTLYRRHRQTSICHTQS